MQALQLEIVTIHNFYRSEVTGANITGLTYSLSVEAGSQAYANYLAANLLFQHSTTPFGENLWMGPVGKSPTNMISAFGNEKQYFKYGIFPDVSTTGDWRDVGHYTQIIWRDTIEVGCAGALGSDGRYRYVCRYNPPGNYYGRLVY